MKQEQIRTVHEAYGPHLILDGYDCNPDRLADLGVIYDFLDAAPSVIGMTKIIPPYVFKFAAQPPLPPEDSGISGFVIIAESHISVHTYPERGFLSLDIFSCKQFPVGIAVKLAVDFFEIRRWDSRVLDRGLEFPRDPVAAKQTILAQRQGHL
jgi:S-adenosylmethionine decarboxylase